MKREYRLPCIGDLAGSTDVDNACSRKNMVKNKLRKYTIGILVCIICFLSIPINTFAEIKNANVFAIYDNNDSLLDLSDSQRKLFKYLKDKLSNIANGSETIDTLETSVGPARYISTRVTIKESDVPNIRSMTENDIEYIEIHEVLARLIMDCPYALYWWNISDDGGYEVTDSENGISITFYVARDFAVKDGDRFYRDKLAENSIINVKKVVENAKKIVKAHEFESDYEKMHAYLSYIDENNSYDKNAGARIYSAADISPYQFTSILDEDTSTNGVCEAYAKAFNLLCDLSHFSSPDVKSYIVSGYLGNTRGPHMWNIVTFGDGTYHIVDATNCDEPYPGAPDKLFPGENELIPSGNILDGYTYALNDSKKLTYIYDEDSLSIYGKNSDSILNLSTEKYDHKTAGTYDPVTNTVGKNVVLSQNKIVINRGNYSKISLSKKARKDLIKNISYSSDNKKVVKISKKGTIKGVKKGSAKIGVTVTFVNGKSKKLTAWVTVK